MKLMILVLSILFERYAELPYSVRCFEWFDSWSDWLENKFSSTYPALILAASILPILIALGLMVWLFGGLLWGSVGFAFELLLFYFCLGPTPIFNDAKLAAQQESPQHYLSVVNRTCFSLIFWYLILGIGGAVVYRLIDRAAAKKNSNSAAQIVLPYLEWIPARITAFLYLLVGNFQQEFPYFLNHFWSHPEKNDLFLVESGKRALKQDSDEIALPLVEQLVWYALILLLVCIALLTLARWL